MRVAVVGGTGCGGRAVVAALRAAGHEVLSVARGRTPGPPADLRCDRGSAAFVSGMRLFDPDAVVDQVAYCARVVRLTLGVLRPGARYLLVSSPIVYGPGRPRPYEETEEPHPPPGLATNKRAAEKVVAHRAGATVLRIGALYGPGHAPMTPLGRDPDALVRLAAGKRMTVPDPDPPRLQPWFAEDHARLVLDLLADPSPPPVLNAAGPDLLSWEAWLDAWAAVIEAPPIRTRPLDPEALRAAAPARLRPFIDAILDPPLLALGHLAARRGPHTPVEEGIRRTVGASL